VYAFTGGSWWEVKEREMAHVHVLLLSECGAYKTVTAEFGPWFPGKSPDNHFSCSRFARKRSHPAWLSFAVNASSWSQTAAPKLPTPNHKPWTLNLEPSSLNPKPTPAEAWLGYSFMRFRAKREHRQRVSGLLPENQSQIPALTVLYVRTVLDSGTRNDVASRLTPKTRRG
jgi:hypothetical protein